MARNQRLDATITIGSVLQKSVGKNLNVIRSGLDSIGDEVKRVTDRQRELSKQRRVLEKQGRSVEALDREYEELGRTLDSLRRKQERFERAQVAARRVGSRFNDMTSQVGRTARNAGIAIGVAAGATFGLASSTASLGDEVAKTADKLGFQIEAYQELRYAAERSGVSVSTFDSSMVAMQKRLGEAAQGTGAAKKALDQLGLSAENLVDMAPEEALAKIAQELQKVDSPARKASIAAQLFSRAGVGMVNMLKDGSSGLEQLREDARKTGYVLTEQAARDAEVFQDSLLNAELSLKGVKNTIGAALLPSITRLMDEMSSGVQENRDQIKEFSRAFAGGVGDAIPVLVDLGKGIGNVSRVVGAATADVAQFVGGWENLGMVVGALLAGKAIASVVRFGSAVVRLGWAMARIVPALPLVSGGIKAIGTALVANPIGGAVAAIAAGGWMIYRNWDGVASWFRRLWGDVRETFDGVATAIGGVWRGDMQAAGDGIVTTWRGVKRLVGTSLRGMGGVFKSVWRDLIKPVTDALGVTEPIVGAWNTLKEGLQVVLDWIGSKFDWVMGKIGPVVDALRWVREKGSAAVGAMGLGGGDAANDDGPPEYDRNSNGTIRRDRNGNPIKRAIGGAFSQHRPLVVGERGPELMYPSQGGFVAHNRQLERIAGLQGRIAGAAETVRREVSNVTQNITINAGGMSVEALVDELERRKRDAQSGQLFDGASGYGQYGGAF